MPSQNVILQYLKHLAFLIGLSAASVILSVGLTSLGALDISKLPSAYQTLATLILPAIILAGQNLKSQLDKEAAQAAATKAIAAASVANAHLFTANAATYKAQEATATAQTATSQAQAQTIAAQAETRQVNETLNEKNKQG